MQRGHVSDKLLESVYDDLRVAAERYFRRQSPGFTLSPTEIVHEAYIHFAERRQIDWTSTSHFRSIAIRKMWQVIVDHLRHQQAQKRGGPARLGNLAGTEPGADGPQLGRQVWKRTPLESVPVEWHDRSVDLLDLDDALAALCRESRRLHDVVKLHWFGGMTYAEVAEVLRVSPSTAEKDFKYALAWLNRRLQGKPVHGH